MSDYITFDEKPTLDDAPAACQYGACESSPFAWVRYRNDPVEYVCYCRDHADACLVEFPGAKAMGRLR